ncbi:micronuclear linker histone polyprotein-like [Pieris brassicae]|uniref:micronuclear linker histone polyprotein-like n=1 Tax=Pieris brassicae TaxID=7116 RepID=UPI001E660563|nr:micronuclear linker histone polyprotein-like [Pieris brassicae]
MLSKYSIYGGGRWREIDIDTGRVAGWAGSNFVCTKRGNLVVLKSKAVLRGLKDLASDHISTVKDGFQLTQLIKKKKKTSKKSPKQIKCKCYYQPKHVCAPNDKILQANLCHASIQCNIVSMNKNLNKINIRESVEKDLESVKTTVSDNIARAITISENDVETFRSYIVHSTNNIFNVDLFMYDSNDDYKRSVFYKITPIVKVQRHPIIQSLVRQNKFKIKLNSIEIRNEMKTLSKKTNYCEPRIKIVNYEDKSDSERDIKNKKVVNDHQKFDIVNKDLIVENKGKRKAPEAINQPKRPRHNNSDSLKENMDVQRDQFEKPINKVFFVKKSSVKNKRMRPTNEFSLLEDEAMVAWIVTNKKGNFVNGNRMWKEMEPLHLKVTGHHRSWHSLRNRYLRHLLPSLGSLSLTPSQVTDLRAAAATGELKANKMNKNNSIYRTEPVRSAWNARPQKLKHSDDEPFTPPRNLRSNVVSPTKSKLPTYSEITRRFAEKHRSTPNSEEEGSLRVVNIDEKQDKKTEEKFVSKSREKSLRYVSRREKSGVEKKNRTGRKRNETDTDKEIKNNKKFENYLASAERSDFINKYEKRKNKDVSDTEQKNEKQGRNETRQENRSSRRLRHERSAVVDNTLGQNRNEVKSDTEHKNQRQGPKTLENRASRRLKSPERSHTKRSIERRKNEDTELENKKKDDNSRSSKRNGVEKNSGLDKNLRKRRNETDTGSESENQKRDDDGRFSTRNKEEMSGVDEKSFRQRSNKNDSDSEPENTKKDDNARSSTTNRDKEKSGVNTNLRQRRNKNDSYSEPENKKNETRFSRRLEEDKSGIHKKNTEHKNKSRSHQSLERSVTEQKRRLKQVRNEQESDAEETKKQDKERERRSSRRLRSLETSHTEKKNLGSRGNLEENDKSGKSDNTFSRNKTRDRSDTDDKENGADNKMYLRKYRYKSGPELENAKPTKKRETGNISKNGRNVRDRSEGEKGDKRTTEKGKHVKVDRSKRKYIEISDSESENEREKKNKRDKRSSGSDSDFEKTSKKETTRNRSRVGKQSDDSDFSGTSAQMSITSKSDFDSSNDNVKKRLTRQSHKVESGSRDNIIFEISDNDEAYASRSDTEVKNTGKRNLRKLFNHRPL